ncbi:Mov34/MPN/PAD-1 family protein [Nocardia bovistercoris]|uniref:Mov34/MPN/PAD-1 family protein n=1 Tax=Nocardia bovistercoris TaxID=2785916 RepID=A0A931N2Z5_9NOCA|nr:Mov34/MPN/PAD-1 family protein [Nocardia bovistercoris]MBH0776586.1 Mov34/MPN/PAD-1 family protein [Nocardia bovistercoris]
MTRSDRDFTVLIHQRELDHLAGWVLESPATETGGTLFGFWTHSGSPAAHLVLGPGPGARRETTAFFQDRTFVLERGHFVGRRYGLQHIGDWHSHHALGPGAPSDGDARTARNVFEHTGFTRFLLLIATTHDEGDAVPVAHGRTQDSTVRVGAFLFERGAADYRTGRWAVLPGESPTATAARRSRLICGAHRPLRRWHVPRAARAEAGPTPLPAGSGWYATARGQAFLRAIDTACRAAFDGCTMVLDTDTGELTYRVRADRARASLVFPSDFPHSPARILWREDHRVEQVEAGGEDPAAIFDSLSTLMGRRSARHERTDDEGEAR